MGVLGFVSKRSVPSLVGGVGESVVLCRMCRGSDACAAVNVQRRQLNHACRCVIDAAFGALYAASGLLINTGKDEYGHLLGAAASAGLVAMMFPRYMATKAIVPSGALVATGALSGVYDTYKSVQIWRNILEDD